MSFKDPEINKATRFYNDCFQLREDYDNMTSDFAATLIGLIKGTGEIVKELSPETYKTICKALNELEKQ